MSSENKYAKYVISQTVDPPIHPRPTDLKTARGTNILWINDEVQGTVPNSTYLNVAYIFKPTVEIGPFQQHAHEFDEYIVYVGTNPEKPYDLDGVVELWLDDEKYILTKSTAVFVPRGVYHLPCIFHEVRTPMIWFTSAPVTHYPYPRDPIVPPPAGYGVV